jgi:hypothetical protein
MEDGDGGLTKRVLLAGGLAGLSAGGTGGTLGVGVDGALLGLLLAARRTAKSALSLLEEVHDVWLFG